MHWHRLVLTGPDAAVVAAAQSLVRRGAQTVEDERPLRLVWRAEAGVGAVEALSRRHPRVTFGSECFEEFADDLVHAVVRAGEVTIMQRGGVLPCGWGSYHDEEGTPLEHGRLAESGSVIAAGGDDRDGHTLFSGLDAALAVCARLGRVACRASDFLADDAPTPETLDEVVRLAVLAADIGCSTRSLGAAELAYERAFQLTRSVVHAGVSEYEETPGNADWSWWLGVLISSASDILEAASHCTDEPVGDRHPLASEHLATAWERLEQAAQGTVTTCVELLTLFPRRRLADDPPPRV